MTEPFLNLHLFVTSSVANANRDDTGAPKQVTYGGVTRHRLSSQAMTRAKRIDFELAAGGDQVSYRAKGGMVDLALPQAADLAQQAGQPLTVEETTKLQVVLGASVSALVMNREKAVKAAAERARSRQARRSKAADAAEAEAEVAAETGDEGADDTGKKDTLTWLAEHEISGLVANSPAQDVAARRPVTSSTRALGPSRCPSPRSGGCSRSGPTCRTRLRCSAPTRSPLTPLTSNRTTSRL